jgi:Ca2+-binding RTX toxin-like protein
MRFASFSVMLCLLAAVLAVTAAADTAAAPEPSCAAGPTTVDGTTYGTACDDVIRAAPGVEEVRGGGGDDTILTAPISASAPCPEGCHLGVGSQTFDGGPGDDVVYGERGNDILKGGEGNDRLFGGIGDDQLLGGPGNDRLAGGFGADSIDGESGDDYVRGDATIDRIRDSGGGLDTLSYSTGITPGFGGALPGVANFPAASGERGLRLELGAGGENAENGVAPFGGGVDEVEGQSFETIVGTPFSDYIVGGPGGETIHGGGGADVIRGEGGDDSLRGGADGDDLDGGLGSNALDGGPGSDRCRNAAAATSCEGTAQEVDRRDPTKVSVGMMLPEQPGLAQLYLVGSNAGDVVTAVYAAGPPTFVAFHLSSGAFDQSAGAAAGCTVSATDALCPLVAPLDSLVLAGMGGDDAISAEGFPSDAAVILSGGEGADGLVGGAASEDVLVDGPGAGADYLSSLGGDDALLHNGGADQLFGGDGNDLFLSNSVCDGESLNGGAGRDNASWARFKETGVGANLGSALAGRPGAAGTPDCGGEPLDSLLEIEDLEGSGLGDVLYGGPGPNQLLGHPGPDDYSAGAGDDSILANSGDADLAIDCGEDVDSALVDHPEYGDPVPVNCELVQEADPNSFRIATELPPLIPPPPAPPPPPADTTPPRTKLTGHPRAKIFSGERRRRVVFRFGSSERGSRFRCKLDRKPMRRCASPRAFLVTAGTHVFRVVAVDRAGNVDRTPALFRFRVLRR